VDDMAAPEAVGFSTGIQNQSNDGQLASDVQEVSLDTLSQEEKDKILRAFKQGRDVANNYYKSEIEPKIIKRMELYKADKNLYKKKFPALSELNNWVSKDIKTTVDWILPNLIEVFNGTESPVEIMGQSVEDDDNAKLLQQLIDYFVTKKNNFFTFLYTFAKDGLVTNFAVAKVYWNREEDRKPMQVMADAQMMQMLMIEQQQGRIEITDAKPVDPSGDYLLVSFDIVNIKTNTPILENMNPSELRFTHEERDIHDAKFVAHRKIVRGDYLKRKERDRVYQNVDEALEKNEGKPSYTTLDIKHDKELESINNKLNDGDTASKEYELYEAYMKVDYNNDGIYEKIIVHVVGDTLLKVQENSFEIPPFFIFSPEYEPYAVFNEEGYADAWEQLQDLKTALVRQIVINTAKNNRGQKFVDDSVVDMDALMDGDEFVPTRDGKPPSEAVYYPPPIPTDPNAMTLIQYVQNDLESQSGSTRYNQGLDSRSLNMTATGISAIMGAADKKIKLIARILAETAWIPIVKFLVLLCQKFVDDGQIIRLLNQNIVVRREQLNIDYDLVVNVGQGAGTKEAGIQYKLMMIQQLYPVLQQVGIVTPQSWYSIVKDLLEDLGIRSTTKYLLDPNSEAYQQMQAQQQQAQQLQQQKEEQYLMAQLQLKEKDIDTKLATKLTAKWNELPVDAKVQALAAIGIQTNHDSVASNDAVLRDFAIEQAKARSWGYH